MIDIVNRRNRFGITPYNSMDKLSRHPMETFFEKITYLEFYRKYRVFKTLRQTVRERRTMFIDQIVVNVVPSGKKLLRGCQGSGALLTVAVSCAAKHFL